MHVAHNYARLHIPVINFKLVLYSNAIGVLFCAPRGNDEEAYDTMTLVLVLESGRMHVCLYEDTFSAVILKYLSLCLLNHKSVLTMLVSLSTAVCDKTP